MDSRVFIEVLIGLDLIALGYFLGWRTALMRAQR